ncbi:MAG: M23 family metallopeptidase [Miltoncostaeaceae bacterium]
MRALAQRAALAAIGLCLAAGPAAAAEVSATGYGALLPGGTQAGASLTGAGERNASSGGLRPAGGGTIASLTTGLTTVDDGVAGSAEGAVVVTGISLFEGRVEIGALRMAARVDVGPEGRDVVVTEAVVEGLVVNGAPVSAGHGSRVAVEGIGTLIFFERSYDGDGLSINAMRVEVTDPAAREVIGEPFVVGHLDLSAEPGEPPATPPPAATTEPPPATTPPSTTDAPERPPRTSTSPPRTTTTPPRTATAPGATTTAPGTTVPAPPLRPSPITRPEATPLEPLPRQPAPEVDFAGGAEYVFPVYGTVGYSDDFLAPRAGTGLHYGNDLFADTGTPLVAVADGRLSKVGVNTLGGNRLWLTDDRGNWFYYAHMSAYAPAAVEGARVRAGQVIGFVGNSGQAITTPPHLHFEIHPGGIDEPAVNPYPHLLAWERGAEETPLAFEEGGTPAAPMPAVGAVVVDALPEVDARTAPEDGLAVPVL